MPGAAQPPMPRAEPSPHASLPDMPLPSGGPEAAGHRTSGMADSVSDDVAAQSPIPPHPLGVKPLGNQYFSTGRSARGSLGSLRVLPDEVLMSLLEYLDEVSLRVLGCSCKFLFAFCFSEELWKAIFLE